MTRSKYKNRVRTEIDGIRFASKAEATLYLWLQILAKRNILKIDSMQEKIYLTKARILYKPDFSVTMTPEAQKPYQVWVECKGFETPTWRIKARLWDAYRLYDPLLVYRVGTNIPKLIATYGVKKFPCLFTECAHLDS